MTGKRQATSCVFVGPFPPPVHGQSVATRDLALLLESRGIVLRRFDSGKGHIIRRLAHHLAIAWRIVTGQYCSVYVSVNANGGMVLTALLVAAARLVRKPLALHHHSYRYIAAPDMLARVLFGIAGCKALHIANCREMGDEMAQVFGNKIELLSFSNVGSVDPSLRPSARPERPITVGHMSNLTQEKGVGRVVSAVIAARQAGLSVRLELAGPCSDRFAEETVARAKAKLGDDLKVHGPVYGPAKQAFFDSIDVFAFPSLYPTETQGIVNLEAMACGKPVVAFAQCCIGGDIGRDGGVAIPKTEDYNGALIDFLIRYAENPAFFSARARARFDTLLHEFFAQRETIFSSLSKLA